jgi:hypothetical protein
MYCEGCMVPPNWAGLEALDRNGNSSVRAIVRSPRNHYRVWHLGGSFSFAATSPTAPDADDQMRKILLLSAKIFISGALLFFALRKISFGDLVSRLGAGNLGWILLAIAIALFQIVFGALRWREITGECGAPLTIAQVLRCNLVASFFNRTLPSSIGGDAVRILLVRRTGTRWRAAGYSVFIDRAIGLAIIVVATLP